MSLPPSAPLALDELSTAINATTATSLVTPPTPPVSKKGEKESAVKTTSAEGKKKPPVKASAAPLKTQSSTQPKFDRWTLRNPSSVKYGVASRNLGEGNEEVSESYLQGG